MLSYHIFVTSLYPPKVGLFSRHKMRPEPLLEMNHRRLALIILILTFATIVGAILKVLLGGDGRIFMSCALCCLVSFSGLSYFRNRSRSEDAHFITITAYKDRPKEENVSYDVGVLLVVSVGFLGTWLVICG